MTDNSDAPVLIFSYGTLQLPEVQRATYGRLLDGRPDALTGYVLRPLPITDPEVVRISGLAVHSIACRTGDPGDRIPGMVFALTQSELEATDAYEVDVYGRVAARLESGETAFVYVAPPEPGENDVTHSHSAQIDAPSRP